MEKTKDTGTWLKFFKDAGIPTKTGASYAHMFVENRIHKDMLSDLTVDHLRLMGITLMGDVIAILRHAKSVHQDSLRKVVILKSKDDPPESSSSSSSGSRSESSSSSCSSSSGSDEDVEMVEITKPAVKKLNSAASRTVESTVKKEFISHAEESRKQVRSKVINNTSSASTNKTSTGSERKLFIQPLKRKRYENEPIEEDHLLKNTVVKTTNSSTNAGRSVLKSPDATVKKIRVTTENNFIGPKLPPPKKTVFDRLGAETGSPQVSSTTEMPKPEVETTFTRVISNFNMAMEPVKIVANIDIPPPKSSSVFNRLGEVTPEPLSGPALPYAGVLKSPVVTRAPFNFTKKIVTMRADEPEVPVRLRAETKPALEKSIKIRVGETSFKPKLTKASQVNGRFTNPASEGIFANPKNALHLSAKERLGLQSRKNALHKSAKGRLGLQNTAREDMSSRPITQRKRKPPSPIDMKHQYSDEDDDEFEFFSEGGAVQTKKVTFGRVEQRFVSPMRSSRGGRNLKSGIHSRLGPRRLS